MTTVSARPASRASPDGESFADLSGHLLRAGTQKLEEFFGKDSTAIISEPTGVNTFIKGMFSRIQDAHMQVVATEQEKEDEKLGEVEDPESPEKVADSEDGSPTLDRKSRTESASPPPLGRANTLSYPFGPATPARRGSKGVAPAGDPAVAELVRREVDAALAAHSARLEALHASHTKSLEELAASVARLSENVAASRADAPEGGGKRVTLDE
jgi:hypothetical protein